MFDWSKGICNKIKESNCLEDTELQMVEVALRTYECHQEILNENLGIDVIMRDEKNLFELEHATHRNSLKRKVR